MRKGREEQLQAREMEKKKGEEAQSTDGGHGDEGAVGGPAPSDSDSDEEYTLIAGLSEMVSIYNLVCSDINP